MTSLLHNCTMPEWTEIGKYGWVFLKDNYENKNTWITLMSYSYFLFYGNLRKKCLTSNGVYPNCSPGYSYLYFLRFKKCQFIFSANITFFKNYFLGFHCKKNQFGIVGQPWFYSPTTTNLPFFAPMTLDPFL